MANTYTQLYVQFVFAVKDRLSLISVAWEEELYKYVTGIVQNNKHKLIAINGMPDHIHVFVGLHTTQSVADLMRVVKGDSSEWINSRNFVRGKFEWQEGYGGFTYSRKQIDEVYKYIINQKEHHRAISFIDEYIKLLKEFEITYDKRYIFRPIE
jgi:putative transposase